jgi:hypothetical protein
MAPDLLRAFVIDVARLGSLVAASLALACRPGQLVSI